MLLISNYRIGNFYKCGNEIKRVTQAEFSNLHRRLNPVLLDDSIIKSLGLNRKSRDNGIFIEYSKKYKHYVLCARSKNNIVCFVKYLHQVQNIYQATTSMELKWFPASKVDDSEVLSKIKLQLEIKEIAITTEEQKNFKTLSWFDKIIKWFK